MIKIMKKVSQKGRILWRKNKRKAARNMRPAAQEPAHRVAVEKWEKQKAMKKDKMRRMQIQKDLREWYLMDLEREWH